MSDKLARNLYITVSAILLLITGTMNSVESLRSWFSGLAMASALIALVYPFYWIRKRFDSEERNITLGFMAAAVIFIGLTFAWRLIF